MKKKRYQVSPNLGDGQHWSVVSSQEELSKTIAAWIDNECDEVGSEFSVRVIEMTDEELAALPEL